MNASCVCRLGISHTRRTHTQQMKQGMLGRPFGHGLPFVYLSWFTALVLLYFACNWYEGFKSRHRDWTWLSYL